MAKKSTPAKAKAKPKPKTPARTPARRPAVKKKSAKVTEADLKKLDGEILKLISRRAEATAQLLEAETDPKQHLFAPAADDELWQRLEADNRGPLPARAVRGVFRQIISAVRSRHHVQRVAYLGPQFSYTHLATIERFGESADLIPVNTIAAVFEEVNRGHADFGMVPIENSTDGRIIDTLDMFTRLPLRICGEVQMSVHHNLLGRGARSDVREIYSKPQALSQCRDWLSRNMPQARLIEVTSTSTAAQLARDKPGAAAVASSQASVEYGLDILAEKIEDNKQNVTRFAVIGDRETAPTGHDRTSVLLQIAHKPGSLSDALVTFKKNRINLTWIESFPLRGPESGYIFFMDFEGHVHDAKIRRTLNDLQQHAIRLEVLGSYPRSEPLD